MIWTANRVLTLIVGMLFTWIGFFGFFASASMASGRLLVFDVDLVQNLFHLITGLLALVATFADWPQQFNRIFGVIYLLLGIAGLFPALYIGGSLFGITHVNVADTVLHIVVGLIACIVGYRAVEYATPARTAM